MFEEFSYCDLKFMVSRFKECRGKSLDDLHALNKTHHSELDEWITPIERELMLDECIARGVAEEDKNKTHYRKMLGF